MSMASDQARANRETRRKTDYGRFQVESESQLHSANREWFVVDGNGDRFSCGTGRGQSSARKDAQALAGALDSAGILELDKVMPEGSPSRWGEADEWEEWAARAEAVPARVIGGGKWCVAGWLNVVVELGTGQIARRLDVSESTVKQYLTDLRAGRR